MLTARNDIDDKLLGFNLGSDDYISKPFSPKELMARVKAVLKRISSASDDKLTFGELCISPGSRTVTAKQYGGLAINLNTNKIYAKPHFYSKIVVRLWLLINRLQTLMEELRTEDLFENEQLLLSLSKSTLGKIVLADGTGTVIAYYNAGHRITEYEPLERMSESMQRIIMEEGYQQALLGESYSKTTRNGSEPISLEIGIPVVYNNQRATVVCFYTLYQLHTVLRMNRNQLITLSVTLTLVASILAAVLSRYFVKPIRIIKDTVDSFSKGDLTAKPRLSLYDEFGQLSRSVEELGKSLKRVDVLRKEVISNVSHELRSPLALIIGYAEMVRDVSWKNEAKRNDNLNLIIQEAGRMSEMVSDIMDYSQFQAAHDMSYGVDCKDGFTIF